MIVQSAQTLVTDRLRDLGYPENKVEAVDGFDVRLFDEQYGESALNKTFVATAFQFDNGGRKLELGSNLTQYLHTIDFIVLGHTPVWGRNVAHVIKAVLNAEGGSIPLRDYNVPTNPRPIIDYLEVESVSAEREYTFDPRPWNAHAWLTRLRLYDEVLAAA